MADITATAQVSFGLSTDKDDGSFNVDQDAIDAASWLGSAGVNPDVDVNPVTGLTTVDEVVDSSGSSGRNRFQNSAIPNLAQQYTASYLVKKVSSPTTFPGVGILFLGGASTTTRYIVDPETGALLLRAGDLAAISTNLIDRGTYWEIELVQTSGINTTKRLEVRPAANIAFLPALDSSAIGNHNFGSCKAILPPISLGVTASLESLLSAQNSVGIQQLRWRGLKIPAGISDKERVTSRNLRQTVDGRSLTRIFVIRGTDDPVSAGDIGPQINDPDDLDPVFFVGSREFNVIAVEGDDAGGDDDGGDANGVLELTVEYGEVRNNFSGVARQSSLNVTGETRHTELALEQDTEPQDAANRIGVSIGPTGKDDELKGADVEEPVIELVETHLFGTFSVGYRTTLLGLVQKVNDGSFRGFKTGEVRFRGFATRKLATGQTEIQYTFAVNRNREFQVELTDDLGGVNNANIDQQGWQWFWAEFGSKDDNGKKVRITRSVSLATVYEEAAFSGLAIGTDPIT